MLPPLFHVLACLARRQDSQSATPSTPPGQGATNDWIRPSRWLRSCGRRPRSSRRQPPATILPINPGQAIAKSTFPARCRPPIPISFRPEFHFYRQLSGLDPARRGCPRAAREWQVADLACERMSRRSKNHPSSPDRGGSVSAPACGAGAPAEGECGRIFRDGSRAGREFRCPSRRKYHDPD
jgi:hypothetical protein